jgi:predicted nucleotidyltransferase
MEDVRNGDSSRAGLIQEAVAAIVEAVAPCRVVLFGSHVRGDAGPDSDIDFLVVTAPGTHRRDTARAIYRRLAGFGHAVDVVVVTTDDVALYRNVPGLIISVALAEGRELYAA